jgi:5-methylthioadenosine/S-adenosylhomocysteine deaminase
MATIAGAEAIGIADRIGSLEVGKQADIVVHRAVGWGWSPRATSGCNWSGVPTAFGSR